MYGTIVSKMVSDDGEIVGEVVYYEGQGYVYSPNTKRAYILHSCLHE